MIEALKDLQDGIGRRRRNAKRQARGVSVIRDSDVKILAFIHHHGGMLTTDIIFKFCELEGLYKNRRSLTYRLRDLYHNLGLIDRPHQQRNIEYPERFNLVHRVSEKGEELLKSRGLYSEYVSRPYGAYQHQMMTACVYASYALNAKEAGIEFTPQHTLLKRLGRGAGIQIDGKKVEPDALFMLTIDGKSVLIFLEVDRATEPGHSKSDKRKSWGRSVEQYQKIIAHKLYKEHYDVPTTCGAQVHVVTVNYSMEHKILREVSRVFPSGCTFILTHTSTAFGEISHPPAYINMLSVEWNRHGHKGFKLST